MCKVQKLQFTIFQAFFKILHLVASKCTRWLSDCHATTKPNFSRARTVSVPESPGNLGMAYVKSGHDGMAVYLHWELSKLRLLNCLYEIKL
jgi:hypothetical protein